MKACPFCAEEIQDAAIVCKHCNRDLVEKPPIPTGLSMNRCHACGSSNVYCSRDYGLVFLSLTVVSCGLWLITYPLLPRKCICQGCKLTWRP